MSERNEGLAQVLPPLTAWFHENARKLPWRESPTPYRVWISEIMLQQTRVEAVKGYYQRFMQALPDVFSLAAVPEEQLLKLWEGLGYYNRARSLKKAAILLAEGYGGVLPADYEKLLKLPGFGPYTAGAVASIAYGLPVAAVDGNVLRVHSRLTGDFSDIAQQKTKDAVRETLCSLLRETGSPPGITNQAIMELGATVCLPNSPPDCACCPLAFCCRAKREGLVAQLPVKTAKRARRIEERTIFLLIHEGRVALRRREEKGLLAGLWELPSAPGHLDFSQAVQALLKMGLSPLRLQPLGEAKHIFTHVEWRMVGWKAVLEGAAQPSFCWADSTELRTGYPLPSAFRYFLQSREGRDPLGF